MADKQVTAGVRQLRSNLKHYLDLVEQGAEVIIIRNSAVMGRLVPPDKVKDFIDEKQARAGHIVKLADNKEVLFRQFGIYEDLASVQELHKEALEAAGAYSKDGDDSDLWSPAGNYEAMGGEFWVGEAEGAIVAMGAFKASLGSGIDKQAELKRMRVKPNLQGHGIGSRLLKLLEERAERKGYTSMVLDVTSAIDQEPARRFYARHGYKETHREHREKVDLIFYRKEL